MKSKEIGILEKRLQKTEFMITRLLFVFICLLKNTFLKLHLIKETNKDKIMNENYPNFCI